MEISIAADGRVFLAERQGIIKVWKPDTKTTTVIGKVDVFAGLEEGMLGITLDPNFLKNGWIYLNHSLPETTTDSDGKKTGIIRISRYTVEGDTLDLASEKKVLDTVVQRDECCHVGGSLNFDSKGNLYVSVGDNTNPFASDGFAPIDEIAGRSPWDAQKSSANPNDLRGKINRIHPEPDGSYTIPEGNLFPPGTPGTRPEIYVMGNRNPFRISVDQRTGYLYWGEVGPDAGWPKDGRGPAGYDEVQELDHRRQARRKQQDRKNGAVRCRDDLQAPDGHGDGSRWLPLLDRVRNRLGKQHGHPAGPHRIHRPVTSGTGGRVRTAPHAAERSDLRPPLTIGWGESFCHLFKGRRCPC